MKNRIDRLLKNAKLTPLPFQPLAGNITLLSKTFDFWPLLALSLLIGVFVNQRIYFLAILSLLLTLGINVFLYFSGQKRKMESLGFLTYFLVTSIIVFTKIYSNLGIISPDGALLSFGDYLYFSIVTWTTLGYGDLLPSGTTRLYARAISFKTCT
ncbi:MAG: ion channel [Thermosynechococcaceae cyanobacterium]